jgi:hypothetical protein
MQRDKSKWLIGKYFQAFDCPVSLALLRIDPARAVNRPRDPRTAGIEGLYRGRVIYRGRDLSQALALQGRVSGSMIQRSRIAVDSQPSP